MVWKPCPCRAQESYCSTDDFLCYCINSDKDSLIASNFNLANGTTPGQIVTMLF